MSFNLFKLKKTGNLSTPLSRDRPVIKSRCPQNISSLLFDVEIENKNLLKNLDRRDVIYKRVNLNPQSFINVSLHYPSPNLFACQRAMTIARNFIVDLFLSSLKGIKQKKEEIVKHVHLLLSSTILFLANCNSWT